MANLSELLDDDRLYINLIDGGGLWDRRDRLPARINREACGRPLTSHTHHVCTLIQRQAASRISASVLHSILGAER